MGLNTKERGSERSRRRHSLAAVARKALVIFHMSSSATLLPLSVCLVISPRVFSFALLPYEHALARGLLKLDQALIPIEQAGLEVRQRSA